MRQRKHIYTTIVLSLVGLLLAGCNIEGLAAFAPTNDRIAVITNDNQLYIANRDGNDVRVISERAILPGFDVTFDPTGSFILYADVEDGVCIIEILADARDCPVVLSNDAAEAGMLSFLPSGDFVLVQRFQETWALEVYQPDGTLISSQERIEQIFIPGEVSKPKRTSNGSEWHLRPYDADSVVRWVTVSNGVVSLWNAGTTVTGPQALPNSLNVAIGALLEERDQTDITSGVLSPDGTRVAFRIDTGNQRYDLYTVNLNDPDDWRRLVVGADFKVEFTFSPDGQMIAYENNIDGHSVWIANSDGSSARRLARNASLPEWHSEIPR